jgi:hypothetical protein
MKKLKSYILFAILIITMVSCVNKKTDLLNTKWVHNFEECKDYFEFKDNLEYNYYSCESDELSYGTYFLVNDTINIEQLAGEFDMNFEANSRHRTPKERYKLLIDEGFIRYLEKWEFKNEKWQKSDFIFDENYTFKKEH